MSGRIAVITGVSKGLGEALAARLLDLGFEVTGVGRTRASRLDREGFTWVEADLGDGDALPARLDRMFAELAARQPTSITVINNAAVAEPVGRIGELDAEAIQASFRVNLIACVIVANAFVRAFAKIGGERRLINVSSGAAALPLPGAATYCIAKAGLEMLATMIDAERDAHGIQAATVRPGIVDTPMQQFIRSQDPARVPSVGMFRDFHASGRLVPPDVTASKIIERLVLGPIEGGKIYSYNEL